MFHFTAQMRLMKLVLAPIVALGACVPSHGAVFSPVDREIERRIGTRGTWHEHTDPRVPPAITALLAKPLDRETAIRIALVTNRRLQAQYDTLGIAASQIADATVLPPLDVDIQTFFHTDRSFHALELDVTQDILALLQLPQRRSAAQASLAAARTRAVAATVELVAEVERAYIDLVASQQELELRQTAFDAASAAADLAERQRKAGNISELVLLREQDRREQAHLDLGRAEVDVATRREAMNEVLGLGTATTWTVASRLPDVPAAAPALDTLEGDAVVASLELAALGSDADAAESRRGIARVRSFLPHLGIGISAHREDGEWEAGPAISFGLPLFDQQQGPRARANAELKRSRNEAHATEVLLRTRARAVRRRVLGAHAEARHLRDVVLPQRQRLVAETLAQYNAMNASPSELLLARRELVDAGRQYIDALRRFWRASADARALARGALPQHDGDAPRAQSTPAPTGGH